MKITRILNNSTVIGENQGHEEVIALSKGTAYGKKVGDEFDKQKIYEIFTPLSDSQKELLLGTIHEIDSIFFRTSQKAVDRLEHEENIELVGSVYITLTDYLATSVERVKKDLYLGNEFIWEVKNYYPKEYRYDLQALKLLDAQFDLNFPEDEVGPTAVHITSGESGNDISGFSKSVDFTKSIVKIARYYFHIDIDYQSLNYNRFAVYLKFFWKVMMYKKDQLSFEDLSKEILNVIKNGDIEIYRCALRIKEYISEKHNYELDNEEIMYLAIHINKIVHGEEK